MRKQQTLISLLLIVGLFLLVACSSGGATSTTTPDQQVQATEEAPPVAEQPTAAAGGGIVAGEDTTSDTTTTEVEEFNQAPMLDSLGLPAVADRLPIREDIAVITPVDGVGQYGGTWHTVTWEQGIPNIKMKLYDPPVRWKADYTGYEPGLAKSFEYNEDGTQLTWHFREGVRWSDGEPFTMDDMRFWWEDIALNADFRVVQVPWWGFNSDGTPMTVEFPDDYTMVMTWDTPRWITTYIVAQGFWEWEPLMKPRHYLEQFHPDYSATGTFEDLERAIRWWENPDHPTLFAWSTESVTAGERVVLVRNPYYWKVDTEGNQLPYIDRIDIAIIPDEEVRVLEASQGKYEAAFRASTNPTDIPFLYEQATSGNYTLHSGAVNGAGGWPCWLINQNFADESVANWEEIGAVLRDSNFRQGISHAMNRERLIDVVWDGIGYPTQGTISPQAWHFASAEGQAVYEEWRDSYIEYDVALANELLDAAGLLDANGDGVRDLPNGSPFTFIVDLNAWPGKRVAETSTESFAGDLRAVGLDVLINNVIDQPSDQLRQDESLYMIRGCHASELDIWTYPDWMFPLRNNRAWPKEGLWAQTGGAEGWEPEPGSPAARLQAIYNAGLAEPTVEGRHQLVYEAIRIHIEEGPFTLGASGDQPMPVIVGNNFHGIPDLVILGPWAPASPGNLHPEQFWIGQ